MHVRAWMVMISRGMTLPVAAHQTGLRCPWHCAETHARSSQRPARALQVLRSASCGQERVAVRPAVAYVIIIGDHFLFAASCTAPGAAHTHTRTHLPRLQPRSADCHPRAGRVSLRDGDGRPTLRCG